MGEDRPLPYDPVIPLLGIGKGKEHTCINVNENLVLMLVSS